MDTDCLYLNGSSYNGNISVSASGIPCQSWAKQCPHRYTMNTTYPELNNAKNFCRNPKNSGRRPWCFTTNRTKRWEYCNIPKCTPDIAGFFHLFRKLLYHFPCASAGWIKAASVSVYLFFCAMLIKLRSSI